MVPNLVPGFDCTVGQRTNQDRGPTGTLVGRFRSSHHVVGSSRHAEKMEIEFLRRTRHRFRRCHERVVPIGDETNLRSGFGIVAIDYQQPDLYDSQSREWYVLCTVLQGNVVFLFLIRTDSCHSFPMQIFPVQTTI